MRLFFAIELPGDVRAALARLRPDDDKDYRWVDPSQLHVTLAFLGEQPESALAVLEQVGAAAAAAAHSGTLRLGQAGSFPPRGAPRVMWIGLDGDVARLLALQSTLAGALRQGGFALEERTFSPHITLARRRERAGPGRPAWPPPSHRLPSGTIPLRELILFQSKLSPRGATYTPLGTYLIGG